MKCFDYCFPVFCFEIPGIKCFYSKKRLQTVGIVTIIIYFILGISPIVISGILYKLIYYPWATEGTMRHLGVLNIISSVLLIINVIMGLIFFSGKFESFMYRTYYIIIEFLSIIFIFAVSIITLIGSIINWRNTHATCNYKYKGVFKNFYLLDPIFQRAEQLLCSQDCKCLLKERAYNEFTKEEVNYAIKNFTDNESDPTAATKLSECPNYRSYFYDILDDPEIKNAFGSIQLKEFENFWGYIEKKFKCNGWCNTTYEYFEDDKLLSSRMVKYSFSDVNNGFVEHAGCEDRYNRWLQRCLKALGSMFLITSVFMGFNFFYTVLAIFEIYKEGQSDKTRNKDEKRRGNEIEKEGTDNHLLVERKKSMDMSRSRNQVFDDDENENNESQYKPPNVTAKSTINNRKSRISNDEEDTIKKNKSTIPKKPVMEDIDIEEGNVSMMLKKSKFPLDEEEDNNMTGKKKNATTVKNSKPKNKTKKKSKKSDEDDNQDEEQEDIKNKKAKSKPKKKIDFDSNDSLNNEEEEIPKPHKSQVRRKISLGDEDSENNTTKKSKGKKKKKIESSDEEEKKSDDEDEIKLNKPKIKPKSTIKNKAKNTNDDNNDSDEEVKPAKKKKTIKKKRKKSEEDNLNELNKSKTFKLTNPANDNLGEKNEEDDTQTKRKKTKKKKHAKKADDDEDEE